LSPHCAFKTPTYRGDNGLRIDFVSEYPKYADSFASFSHFAKSFKEWFQGTVIRIPLRTEAQAKSSEIIGLEINPDDVLKEFKAFQNEVAESLLFLKNIEKIEFKIDDRILGVAEITNVDESSTARTSIKSAITDGVARSLAFQLTVHHQYEGNLDLRQTYHIQHKLGDINKEDSSREFKEWATNESYFPWIALAAPLNTSPVIQSRIFVTLPLPIFMQDNRVNVHGMFALSRDRRSLWTMMDAQSDGKITNEIQWNTYLYKKVVPIVWQEMLVELAKLGKPVYDYFPIISPRPLALDDTLAQDVLDVVLREDNPIWYSTMSTMLPISAGFVAFYEEPSTALLCALNIFSIPVFNNLPRWQIQLLQGTSLPYQKLTPPVVRNRLRNTLSTSPENPVSISTAVELLKYILSDECYGDCCDLPLFPCKDGKLYSLKWRTGAQFTEFTQAIYLSTPEEFVLFGGNGDKFLDLSVCHKDLARQFERDIKTISQSLNLREFSLDSFRLYAWDVGLLKDKSDEMEIEMEGNINFAWVSRVWKWLNSYPERDISPYLGGLYLIPLQESNKLYKVRSTLSKLISRSANRMDSDLF
jgi:sacsin